MSNRIIYLISQAKKYNKLPATGNELFHLQKKAFSKPKNYDEKLDLALQSKFDITLDYWIKETTYMHKAYFPTLSKENRIINNFITRYAKQLGCYHKVYQYNYFYSLLNNAAKMNQIQRKKVNGRYIYFGVTQ